MNEHLLTEAAAAEELGLTADEMAAILDALAAVPSCRHVATGETVTTVHLGSQSFQVATSATRFVTVEGVALLRQLVGASMTAEEFLAAAYPGEYPATAGDAPEGADEGPARLSMTDYLIKQTGDIGYSAKISTQFGKLVAREYRDAHDGANPPKAPTFIPERGVEVDAFFYTEADRPLFDAAWSAYRGAARHSR